MKKKSFILKTAALLSGTGKQFTPELVSGTSSGGASHRTLFRVYFDAHDLVIRVGPVV